jgi:very-short-patch-repair endonuclease
VDTHHRPEFKFRRQSPIGRYIVDFVCHERHLIVEVDGSQHAGQASDVERDAWLAKAGYRVIRFWNNEVFAQRRSVAEAIFSALTSEAQ